MIVLELDYGSAIELRPRTATQTEFLANREIQNLTIACYIFNITNSCWERSVHHFFATQKIRYDVIVGIESVFAFLKQKANIAGKRAVVLMDNAGSENKNIYTIGALKDLPNDTTFIYKIPYHGKSLIDAYHQMPSDFASKINEHEESSASDINTFITKIREYESILAEKRPLEFHRFFHNLESLRLDNKRRTIAKGLILSRRIRMVSYANKSILASNKTCICSFCLHGDFARCSRLINHSEVRNIRTDSEGVTTIVNESNQRKRKRDPLTSLNEHTNAKEIKTSNNDPSASFVEQEYSEADDDSEYVPNIKFEAKKREDPLEYFHQEEITISNRTPRVRLIQSIYIPELDDLAPLEEGFEKRLGRSFFRDEIRKSFLPTNQYRKDILDGLVNRLQVTEPMMALSTRDTQKILEAAKLKNREEILNKLAEHKTAKGIKNLKRLALAVFMSSERKKAKTYLDQPNERDGHYFCVCLDYNLKTILIIDHSDTTAYMQCNQDFEFLFKAIWPEVHPTIKYSQVEEQGLNNCGPLILRNIELSLSNNFVLLLNKTLHSVRDTNLLRFFHYFLYLSDSAEYVSTVYIK